MGMLAVLAILAYATDKKWCFFVETYLMDLIHSSFSSGVGADIL